MIGEFCACRTPVVPEGTLCLAASIVTIGAFDGVHLGHQALIGTAVTTARAQGVASVVWTFDPPPKVFFTGAAQLCTLDDKLARIAALGPDHIVLARFNRSYRTRTATQFLQALAQLHPVEVHVGMDFRFGAGQAGDVALLAQHFTTRIHETVRCEQQEVVSSSRIRTLRAQGQQDCAQRIQGIAHAEQLLTGWMLVDHQLDERDSHV